ncbi:YihY/virulence factor BrkB family protein [Subtercola sp. Z020]|uniref:YihY/virulence factor BrkB family protein n=1 Tax=Subtercola sp. Z020 TaxID=2080582 RepID=UPI00130E8C55|nr:YihY/virulence factor BrkB family protein [Subtercola sp. Z020]
MTADDETLNPLAGIANPGLRHRSSHAEYRELDRRALFYAARRTYHGFFRHRGIDSGAALTFYAALAVFPSVLAVVSVVSLLDPRGDVVKVILSVIDSFIPQATLDTTRLALEQFTQMPDPVITLVAGSALTLWTVGSYATAFGRMVNSVYEIEEGRRFFKLRLLMLIEALALIVMLFAITVTIIITPSIAGTIVSSMHWPPIAADVWNVLKWPVLALLAVFSVVVLYYGTPNIRRPRVRWLSLGATFSIAAWALTTAGYSIYVSNFAAYDQFYGLLGGAILTLIWLFLSNLVLVIGVEVDAELTRARELLKGVEAEQSIPIVPRDLQRNVILERRLDHDISEGREIRTRAVELADPDYEI